MRKQCRVGLALALLPMVSGCAAAVALPLLAGGTLMATEKHRVRAATKVPVSAAASEPSTPKARDEIGSAASSQNAVLTDLKELPAPSVVADDPWQRFVSYATGQTGRDKDEAGLQSALLRDNPSLDTVQRRECTAKIPAVVIDLDQERAPFDPQRLSAIPAGLSGQFAKLRAAGVVVLWISKLPAEKASDVAQALRASGLDPMGEDQLLLIRNKDDRKQLLRKDADEDVCVVAVAGDTNGDFDELFDYLRNPGSAVGLYPMMGNGWFLVPSLTAAPTTAAN